MENKTDFDDIDLNEFNFDDLPEIEEVQEDKSDCDDISVADIQLEDSVDTSQNGHEHFFSDESSENDTQKNEKKEPFFETIETLDEGEDFKHEQLDEEELFENNETVIEENDGNVFNENEGFDNEIVEIDDLGVALTDDVSKDVVQTENDNYALDNEIIEEVIGEDDSSSENEEFSLMRNETVEREGFAFADIEENETVEEAMSVDEMVSGNAIDEVTDRSEDDFVVADEVAHDDYFAKEKEYSDTVGEAVVDNDAGYGYTEDYSPLATIKKSGNYGFLHWYSGGAEDAFFEFGRDSESGSFDANEECKAIHVNVGYDTYGWEVQFSDGVVMNLRDVREYQIRNGRLPSSDGRIVYGQTSLMFSGVERIVVYERVRYFSYGV